jgi:aryl-alcohol dehydrogenase-like predicted oxidoreductase
MSVYFEKSYQRGFGTYPLKGEPLKAAIHEAIMVGYRAFDTAQMYGNEAETGEALAESGVDRSEFCITTKVHPDNYSEEKFLPSIEASLKALRVDQVDVLMLHWPAIGGENAQSLRLLQKAFHIGLARNIGISNYTARMMRDAQSIIEAPLVTNQVEFHPAHRPEPAARRSRRDEDPTVLLLFGGQGRGVQTCGLRRGRREIRQDGCPGGPSLDLSKGCVHEYHVDKAGEHQGELRDRGFRPFAGRHEADRRDERDQLSDSEGRDVAVGSGLGPVGHAPPPPGPDAGNTQ